jgi:TolB-like protein
MSTVILGVLLAATAPTPSSIPLEPKPTMVQVLPLASENGVDPASAKVLTEFLATSLALHKELKVFGQSDLQALLRQAKDRRTVGCDNAADACLAEVAGALGAEWLVTGTVGRLGEALVLSVRVLDTHKHNVLAQASKITLGEPSELLRAVQEIVPELLRDARPEAPPPPGRSPVAYLLATGTALTLVTAGIFAGWTIANYVANNAARNDFLSGTVLPSGYAGMAQYSSTQGTLHVTAAVADISAVIGIGLGVATVITW